MPKSSPKRHTSDDQVALEAQIAALESNRAELEQELRTVRAGWQRTQADFANAQRRWEEDRHDLVARCSAETLLEIAPALDNFDRAFTHLGQEHRDWATGFQHIKKQLDDVLASHGLERITTVGQPFDPTLHEAVSEEPSDQPEGTVVREVESGYTYRGRMVKPARVVVSQRKTKT